MPAQNDSVGRSTVHVGSYETLVMVSTLPRVFHLFIVTLQHISQIGTTPSFCSIFSSVRYLTMWDGGCATTKILSDLLSTAKSSGHHDCRYVLWNEGLNIQIHKSRPWLGLCPQGIHSPRETNSVALSVLTMK